MRRKPATSMSETYNINMSTFEDGQPEELLVLLKNSIIAKNGTGPMSAFVQTNYLRKMLRGGALREFGELSSQNSGTTNSHVKHIVEVLLGFFFNQYPI